jgi:uncharacterized protein (TIGR02391 family)
MKKDDKQEEKILTMTFDPNLIDDLGARLYSTLPPIIAELIANAYDACATKINIELFDENDDKKIIISDNGFGMNFDDVDRKYLHIGRKRRESKEDRLTECGRLPIGKKGIGKLAFFGIAKNARIKTIKNSKMISFEMNWDKIKSSGKLYKPDFAVASTRKKDGTKIMLSDIFRKTDFDADSLKRSISNYFIFDKNFKVSIKKNAGKFEEISNNLRYEHADRKKDFSWKFPKTGINNIKKKYSFANKIKGEIILFDKPVRSNLRGVTLFSRKKLVNLPEFFPVQGSSHFFQYLTGWLEIDFIDDLKPDVISTNRSSLTWTDDNLQELKEYLGDVISFIHKDWRKKKGEKIKKEVSKKIRVDANKWKESNKNNKTISDNLDKFYKLLSDPEKIETGEMIEVSEIIYNLAPEYADFVLWRNLNKKINDNSIIKEKFFAEKYLEAAREAVQIYNEEVQTISGSKEDGCPLMDLCFKKDGSALIHLTDKSCESEQNIDLGHQFLSKGVITGFRNPALGHTSLTKAKKTKTFSDRNCLDILSTISYLFDRLEGRKNHK